MTTKSDIVHQWSEECPSFREPLSVSCANYGEDLLYVHAGEFARHLHALYRTRSLGEFPAIGAWIERLHTEGDHYVREFATIGILESIQNAWSQSDTPPHEFLPFLGPISTDAWHNLNKFWKAEIPYVPDPRNS